MFATTIKKEWWNKKMEQYKQKGYFYEYKRCNSYWDVRLRKINALPVDAVFLVGSVPHRASITQICQVSMYNTPVDICKFLMKDANALMSDMVWVLKCENVSGEREVYTNEEKEIYRKFDDAQKELDKEREDERE